MKLVDKLDAIPLEMIVQHELEEIEAQKGETYEERDIVPQCWIQGQTRFLKIKESIHDGLTYMKTQLNEEESISHKK